MPESLFTNVLLPVADEEDAASTAAAVLPYVRSAGGAVTVVHVIQKAGGAPDKAGVEQRQEHAERIFDAAKGVFEQEEQSVRTRIAYGTDVSETILDVATEMDASAVVFTPRGGSRWIRLLTGDTALDMITENDRPVIVLPERERQGDGGAEGTEENEGPDTTGGTHE
jgi:nucleotide-binding universal stress UspA family protein